MNHLCLSLCTGHVLWRGHSRTGSRAPSLPWTRSCDDIQSVTMFVKQCAARPLCVARTVKLCPTTHVSIHVCVCVYIYVYVYTYTIFYYRCTLFLISRSTKTLPNCWKRCSQHLYNDFDHVRAGAKYFVYRLLFIKNNRNKFMYLSFLLPL
jgi:hypothetical protein